MSSRPFRVADALAVLEAEFAERSVTINAQGDRIGYRQWGGRGPVVVLLHGISSSAASWLPCAQVLSQTMRVFAWDAPGYGRSTPLEQAEPRAVDYAQRLQAWLGALQVKPDVIVGHSLGALMAAAYMAHAPEALQPGCVLLLNPAQGYGQPGHEGPSHIHTDVEEVFFILRGKVKLVLEKDGERFETILTDRDIVSVPPGVYREEINIGVEDALMCVMLGAKKPITPTYPPDHPLAKIKR